MGTIALVIAVALAVHVLYEIYRVSRLAKISVELGKLAKPFMREVVGAKERILVIGDSIAYGTAASTPEHSLAGLLGRDLPHATIVNRGENAMHLKELIERFKTMQNERYDRTFIYIGGIEVISLHHSLERARDKIREALDLAKNMSSHIVLIGPGAFDSLPMFRSFFRVLLTYRCRKLIGYLTKTTQERGVVFVDLSRPHVWTEFRREPKRYFAKDKIHPNDEGYKIWYREIRKAL